MKKTATGIKEINEDLELWFSAILYVVLIITLIFCFVGMIYFGYQSVISFQKWQIAQEKFNTDVHNYYERWNNYTDIAYKGCKE